MPGPGGTAHASQRCSRGAGAGVSMLRADKFTWVTFPKTMLGAGFFHKVFSLIFLSVAFEVRSYWIPGAYAPSIVQDAQLLFKAIEKEGLQGGKGVNN
jgi:hypothetical protein